MSWIEAVILGIVQGLTEFLPVSSSGHLVLAQHLLGVNETGVLLEVILHMGTLAAILIYFYDDIKQLFLDVGRGSKDARIYIMHLVLATIPAAAAGYLFGDRIETAFTPSVVIWMLLITGIIVGSTRFFQNRSKKEMVLLTVLFIGFSQAFALLPGISRSGLTISTAMILGIQHDKAAKFAIFMAIPVLLGAGLLQVVRIETMSSIALFPLILGFFSSAITGYLVISWLLAVISQGKFYLFSLYCFMIALLAFNVIN